MSKLRNCVRPRRLAACCQIWPHVVVVQTLLETLNTSRQQEARLAAERDAATTRCQEAQGGLDSCRAQLEQCNNELLQTQARLHAATLEHDQATAALQARESAWAEEKKLLQDLLSASNDEATALRTRLGERKMSEDDGGLVVDTTVQSAVVGKWKIAAARGAANHRAQQAKLEKKRLEASGTSLLPLGDTPSGTAKRIPRVQKAINTTTGGTQARVG